jgi:hypothetical protein
MQVKKIAGAALAALAVLVLVAVVVSNPFSTQASTGDTPSAAQSQPVSQSRADTITPSQVGQPEGLRGLQATEGEEETKPFIGVAITPLADGSIKVVHVLEDGPSDGVLRAGDIITSVDGEAITEIGDLTGAIADAGVGVVITLTITRDGGSQDVDVTVGETEIADDDSLKRAGRWPFGYYKGLWSSQSALQDRFARAEIVLADEDGNYQTHRVVVGTATNIDADEGTFTLEPRDGSESIDYTIDDETHVKMDRRGNIGALNSSDDTMVMDIDGKVVLVHQGDTAPRFRWSIGQNQRGGHKWPARGFRGMMRGFHSEPGMADPDGVIGSILERIERDHDGQTFRFHRTVPSPSSDNGDSM